MLPAHLPGPPRHRITIPFSVHSVPYRAVLDAKCDPPLWVEGPHGGHFPSPAKREWKAWKLLVGDIDGDGRPDLLLGVIKPTHQLHFPHTCLFIYSFDGKKITRKWLSSTLGRPLLDYCLARPDKRGWQPVFTLERLLDGRVALSRYRWRVFGLHHNSDQVFWHLANHLKSSHGMIHLTANGKPVHIDPVKWK